ncbi:MAG: hypothetical protein KIS92_15925 [Planctomycetota bacterium]|nr:hypothetical protein [Planctomycetota bacterium]
MPARTAFRALPALLLIAAAAAAFDEGPPKPVPAPAVRPGNANLSNLKLPAKPRVMVIPVNDEESTRYGMIDWWQAKFVTRRLREARREKYDLVILEITTNGGVVGSCDKINQEIAENAVPVVSFVKNRAFSGGALISLGCQAIAMGPGSQIGGAQVIGLFGDLGHDERMKANENMIKGVLALAEKNGYPQAIARGMVDSNIEIFETDDPARRFVTDLDLENMKRPASRQGPLPQVVSKWKAKDEILSLTSEQAYASGLASGLYQDREALFTGMGVQPSEVYENGVTAAEKVARFFGHPIWMVLLVIVGLVALVWELKSPGHGVGFAIFGLCMGLFFWLAIFGDTAGTAEVLLFGLGALLLGVELFLLPGFGAAGFGGVAMILLSILLSFLPEGTLPSFFKAPGEIQPFEAQQINYGMTWALVTLATFMTVVGFALYYGVKLPGLSRLQLRSAVGPGEAAARDAAPGYTPAYPNTSKGPAAPAAEGPPEPAAAALLGKEGVAESVLRPAGKVRLEGASYDAVTEGDWVEAGRKVKVLAVRGTGLVVRAI